MKTLNTSQRNKFSKIYHHIIKKKGLTSVQVAKRSRIRPQYLYHVLSPRIRFNASLQKIKAICKGLGLTEKQNDDLMSTILKREPTDIKLSIPQRQRFSRIYHILIKQARLNTVQVAKRAHIKKTYLYNLVSVKNRHKLPINKSRIILKAVGLTKEQTTALIKSLLDNKSIEVDKITKSIPHDSFHDRIRKAVEARKSDLTNKEIAKKYHVGIASIYNYARKFKQNTKKPRGTQSKKSRVNPKQQPSQKSKSKEVKHKQSVRPLKQAKAKRNLRAQNASVTKRPSKPVEQKTAKSEQNGGITLFKPEHTNDLSPLAQAVKDHMANQQMNVRSLVYRTGLNRKHLHEYFNGSIQTLPRLTVFRLALGLKMNPNKMMELNLPKITVKTIPLDSNLQPRDVKPEPKPANNRTNLKELIEIAKGLNDTDLHILKAMASRMQVAEKQAN